MGETPWRFKSSHPHWLCASPALPGDAVEEDIPFEGPEEPSTAVALEVRPAGGLGLFGTGGPAEQLVLVEQAATELKRFVVDHDLTLEMEDGTDYLKRPSL